MTKRSRNNADTGKATWVSESVSDLHILICMYLSAVCAYTNILNFLVLSYLIYETGIITISQV